MPSLGFVLPHWLYWGTLIVFPLIAMALVQRQKRRGAPRGVSLFLAYLFWVCSGFAGLHRFYLKSAWGFVYIPLLLFVIHANNEVSDAREDVSRTRAAFEAATLEGDRAKADTSADAAARKAKAEAELDKAKREFAVMSVELSDWRRYAEIGGGIIALLLLIDAVMIPFLVRRRNEIELNAPAPAVPATPVPEVHEIGTAEDPTLGFHTRFTDWIEWFNTKAGMFVAYWAILSVFGYFYEVVARFIFNSPTNWLHESMFLMYGMQYMLAGAYAYLADQHVRVDVFYAKFSPRGKAIADIVTSVFFFIFTATMMWTGARFALDAIEVQEHSFTEWGVQYWPVKLMIPVGAALIVLQGIARLIKDIVFVARRGA